MIENNDNSFTIKTDLLSFFSSLEPKSDKGTSHAYIEGYYNQEFSLKKDENIKLLEIGIRQGFSHYLWSKFFVNGEIHGVDNGDSGFTWDILNNTNVKIYTEDAYTTKFTNKFEKNYFDYIIEDGSHIPQHQIKSVSLYYPLLKKGGKLIIEDVGNMNLAETILKEGLKYSPKSRIIDLRNIKDRWDDIIVEIEKV